MKLGINKRWPIIALTLASLTSTAFAVDDMQMRNLENRVSALEQKKGANGMINPPARPVVRDGINLWTQVEAIWFRPQEDGLYYVQKVHNGDFAGKIHNAHFNWAWGFRLGVGYNLPHDGWDLLMNWTRYRTDATQNTSKGKKSTLRQTLINPIDTNSALTTWDSARAKVNLHYNVLDLEMGREFFVSKWLTIRPQFGGRALWIKRNLWYRYPCSDCSVIVTGRHVNHFSGGGLRGGFNTQWGFGMGLSLYGDLALSLLYGTQRLHQKGLDQAPAGPYFNEKTRDGWVINRPMLDLGIGVRWDRLLSNDTLRLRLQLGWEQHILWGFAKGINYVDGVGIGNADIPGEQGKFTFNNGDFTISGLTFQARFDF